MNQKSKRHKERILPCKRKCLFGPTKLFATKNPCFKINTIDWAHFRVIFSSVNVTQRNPEISLLSSLPPMPTMAAFSQQRRFDIESVSRGPAQQVNCSIALYVVVSRVWSSLSRTSEKKQQHGSADRSRLVINIRRIPGALLFFDTAPPLPHSEGIVKGVKQR